MYINIKMGFQDILKNIKFIVTTTAFLTFLSFISVAIVHTIVYMSSVQNFDEPIALSTVYSEYEFDADPDIVMALSDLFEEKAVSHQYSNSLSEMNRNTIFTIFGNPEILGIEKISNEDLYAFTFDDQSVESVQYGSLEIPVQNIDVDVQFSSPGEIYVVFNGEALEGVLQNYFDHDISFIIDVIENTYLFESDYEAIESIINDISGLELSGRFQGDSGSDEGFLYLYLIPLFLVLLVFFTLSYLNLQKENILRKRKELTIHRLHGATFFGLFLRFSISTLLPIITSYLVSMYLSRGAAYQFILLNSTYGLITILMLAYIIHVLNVLNLGDNIRGDLQ